MTLYTAAESKSDDGDYDLANKTYNMNDVNRIVSCQNKIIEPLSTRWKLVMKMLKKQLHPLFPPANAATAKFQFSSMQSLNTDTYSTSPNFYERITPRYFI